jgi:hypothetical protein
MDCRCIDKQRRIDRSGAVGGISLRTGREFLFGQHLEYPERSVPRVEIVLFSVAKDRFGVS